jgi:orotate phosphoribosyltransferase
MAIIDDLVASGLSLPQAQQVIAEDTNVGGTNTDGLVAAGFSVTEALAFVDYDNNGKTAAQLNNIVIQGAWSGQQLTAIKAALDVN